MKENKYDDPDFFDQYRQMDRSVHGLHGAGEWHILQRLLPDFKGKRVLDLGCGFGWHCRYAVEKGAVSVTGIDISEKMLQEAGKINNLPEISYIRMPVEEIDYPENTFDVVISSLTFHYIPSFQSVCEKIQQCLTRGGHFVFSVEHPVYTAQGRQEWIYNGKEEKEHWPVDNYFQEGKREAVFLGKQVIKYHKTLTTYIRTLLLNGFELSDFVEPVPEQNMLDSVAEMKDELRRPMMLIISAIKK
ncbi:MAG: class I SAM-dependent methyltransferase [Candidatus Azobacteroides sp.]|nr:class I SAM-dependent methyltransferase [Candidatus Azobacteroides sp.]